MSQRLQHTLIRASAGTGKTHQLANRYIALLLLQSAHGTMAPEKLVALTFTRKGAGEFGDRILSRLAIAAQDPKRRTELRQDLELLVSGDAQHGVRGLAPGAKFRVEADLLQHALALVVDQSDRLALGTIDSFMARSVQSLAFELGLGGFEILEDAAAEAIQNELLAQVFHEAGRASLEAFHQTLKRATLKSSSSLQRELRAFVESHHQMVRSLPAAEAWGGSNFWSGPVPAAPGRAWQEAALALKNQIAPLNFGHKGVSSALAACLEWLTHRSPGTSAGKLPSWLDEGGQLQALWEHWPQGDWHFDYAKKSRTVPESMVQPLRGILRDWLAAETAALSDKTAAIYEIVGEYERLYDRQARRKGRLAFDDLPLLLETGTGEQSAAEFIGLLSFRWFLRFDHWLLDEFQDTSRIQWEVLKPWLDEAIQDDTGQKSVFVVGDPKQSIYGWRGGEPRLFDDLIPSYPGAFSEQIMARSWRSRPSVLELVNCVCDPGRNPALRDPQLFLGAGQSRWRYDAHEPESSRAGQPGYAAVLLAPDALPEGADAGAAETGIPGEAAEKLAPQARVIQSVLQALRPVERGLTCSILVRKNDHAQAIAQWLRAHDTPNVMVEGDAHLADQSPLVVALADALRWLNQPAHTLAGGHIQLTPLWTVLQAPLREAKAADLTPGRIWRHWREQIIQSGAAQLTSHWCRVLAPLCPDAYSQHSLRQVEQLAHRVGFELALPDWLAALEQLKVRETAAAGCVHVMTIHKAKGLGFDLVLLPDLDSGGGGADEILVRRDRQGRPAGCLVCPPKWLRAWVPDLKTLKQAEELEQDLEALCVLYVALTRAKAATFVILQKEQPRRASHARAWLVGGVSAGADGNQTVPAPWGEGELLWEHGSRELASGEGSHPETISLPRPALNLLPPLPRRERRKPSQVGHGSTSRPASLPETTNRSSQEFGIGVHQVFEQIEWWDLGQVLHGLPEAVAVVQNCLKVPEIRALFARESSHDEVCRELPVELVEEDTWWSGLVDRLVLRKNAQGILQKVVLIDFKTDTVEDTRILRERYSDQLALYRRAVAAALNIVPGKVEAVLVSTQSSSIVAW